LTSGSLDSPFIVFYGDQHEAEPATLTGSVVLNNPDHMNVRNIRVKLEGKWRVSWAVNNGPSSPPSQSSQMIRDRGVVVADEQTFIPAPGEPVTTHRIAPGRHEWRFSFTLDPTLPESVEGLSGNFVVYHLTAELDRGYLSKGFLARKHVRIVRTLSRDMTETVPFPYVSCQFHSSPSSRLTRYRLTKIPGLARSDIRSTSRADTTSLEQQYPSTSPSFLLERAFG
jgi:hypothetical protein